MVLTASATTWARVSTTPPAEKRVLTVWEMLAVSSSIACRSTAGTRSSPIGVPIIVVLISIPPEMLVLNRATPPL